MLPTRGSRVPFAALVSLRRVAALLYGWLAYFLYVRSALYLVGFLGNLYVEKSIDSADAAPSLAGAGIDLGLLAVFALPHSLLARPRIKQKLRRWVPVEIERSSYVLVAALSLALVIWQWRPLPAVLWEMAEGWPRNAVFGLFAGGWVLSLAASKSLGHLRLFGLGAAWAFARGRAAPEPELVTRGLYGVLRHPMYLGFLIGCWAAPRMSAGHLLFAVAMSAYVAIGIRFEERDLERRFGERFTAYRDRVGGFVPHWRPTAR
jgi:methanethiol S-methyltransferase